MGGGVRRSSTDDRFPTRYLPPSVPPPLPLLPDETPKVRPFVIRTEITPTTSPRPYYVALCTLPHIGGGDDLSPRGQNRGYAPNFEIGSRGAEEDRELPRPFRSSVRPRTMTNDDSRPSRFLYAAAAIRYRTIPPPHEKDRRSADDRRGGGGRPRTISTRRHRQSRTCLVLQIVRRCTGSDTPHGREGGTRRYRRSAALRLLGRAPGDVTAPPPPPPPLGFFRQYLGQKLSKFLLEPQLGVRTRRLILLSAVAHLPRSQ